VGLSVKNLIPTLSLLLLPDYKGLISSYIRDTLTNGLRTLASFYIYCFHIPFFHGITYPLFQPIFLNSVF